MEETCVLLIWEEYPEGYTLFKIPRTSENEELINSLSQLQGVMLGGREENENVGQAMANLSCDIAAGKFEKFKVGEENLTQGFFCHSIIQCGIFL